MSPDRWVWQVTWEDLLAVVELMKRFPGPWYVSGGWAIDLFLGRVTREHEDLDIGLARSDQEHLHVHLAGWQMYTPVARPKGVDLVPWLPGMYLELPAHEIVARRQDFSPPEFEILLNEVRDGEWLFRRRPAVRRPVQETYLLTEEGIPVVAPEIQLLFKSGGHRLKDEQDFRMVLPHLGWEQCAWLREALEVYRPGDPWIEELSWNLR